MSHKFRAEHGALKTTEGKAEVPSLDKEGRLRPLRKCREASLPGADGAVGSSHRLSEVERPTPAPPPKERDHLLDGAASPPWTRRGLRLSRRLSQTPVSSGRLVGNDQPRRRGTWLVLIRGRGRCVHIELVIFRDIIAAADDQRHFLMQ